MDQMKRYAIYYAPREGAFADAAAAWLGWDMPRGQRAAQALPAALAKLTEDPRKYGFHGTLKAPFRLTEGLGLQDLTQGLRALAGQLAPLRLAGLELSHRHGFLALTPLGAQDQLQALASEVVRALEPYRAALTAAEYARRRPESLSHRQRELLDTKPTAPVWALSTFPTDFRRINSCLARTSLAISILPRFRSGFSGAFSLC